MSTLGERLRKLRRERDWTQQYVSNHLSVVRSTYAYYELGKTNPDSKALAILSDLYGVSIDYLLTGRGRSSTAPLSNEPPNERALTFVKDGHAPIYLYEDARLGINPEWNLREIEQRLLIAFRYMSSRQQQLLLEAGEKMALQAYEERKRREEQNGER